MFQNVADSEISAGESASFLISQMIAFGIEADNAVSIIDKVNEVSNTYAVSSADLASALGVVASSSSAMGNNIDETIGLVTAITEQTRNANTAARGINSIMASLASVLDENSSKGKAVAKIFEDVGVSMYDANGQLLSGFDLLSGLSGKWSGLDENTQKYIATTIAGKTQLNNFLALMNNFDHATEAVTTSQESAGSAAKENARYMESLDAKVSKVKSAFQQLATSVVDSGLVKGLLDLATGFLQLANTPIGTFVTQAALLGGVLWGGAGLIKAANILPNLFGGIASGAGALSKVGGVLSGVLGLSAGKFLLIAGAIAAVIAVAPTVVDWFKKMIDPVYDAESKLADYNEELTTNKQRLEELEKVPEYRRTDTINDEIEALRTRNEELEKGIELKNQEFKDASFNEKYSGKIDVGESVIIRPDEEFGKLFDYQQKHGVKVVESYQEALDFLVESGLEDLSKINLALVNSGGDAEKAFEKLGYGLQSRLKQVTQEEYFTGLVKEIEDMNTAFFANNQVVDQDFINKYAELSQELKTLKQDMEGVSESEIDSWMNEVISKYGDLIDATPELQDAFYDVGTTIVELNDNIPITTGQFEQLERQFPEIASLLEETSDGYVVAADKLHDFGVATGDVRTSIADLTKGLTINSEQFAVLESLYPEAAKMLKKNGDEYSLASNKVDDFVKAIDGIGDTNAMTAESAENLASGISNVNSANDNVSGSASNAADSIKNEANAMRDTIRASTTYRTSLTSDQNQLTSTVRTQSSVRRNELYAERDLIQSVLNKYAELDKKKKPNGGGSFFPYPLRSIDEETGFRGVSFFATEEQLDDQTDVFKEQIEIMEHRLFLMEKEGKSENDRIKQIRAIQAELEKQKRWYYSQGLDANSEYIRDLEKQWWGFEDDIKDLYKDQAEVYETLFSAVSDRAKEEIDILKDKKDKIKEENEALEEQIQKQEALDALARAKQQKILVFKDGKMQYVSDVDAVSKAQQDLDKIEREDALKEQLEAIDKEIDKWEEIADKWGSIPKEYKKFQDRLMLEQKLGIKLEGENWEKRLGNLQDYVNKYNELMSKANAVGKVENAVVKPFVPKSAFGPNAVNASSGIRLQSSNPMQTSYSFDNSLVRSMNNAPLPSSFGMKDFGSKMQKVINIAIDKFNPNLPNVFDGEGFAEYMRNNFWRETLHYVKA